MATLRLGDSNGLFAETFATFCLLQFLTRFVTESLEAVGDLKFPGSTLLAESMKILWDAQEKSAAQDAENKQHLAMFDVTQEALVFFSKVKQFIRAQRERIPKHCNLLPMFKKIAGFAVSGAERATLCRRMSVGVYRALVPSFFNDVSARRPGMLKQVAEDCERKVPQSWVQFPEPQTVEDSQRAAPRPGGCRLEDPQIHILGRVSAVGTLQKAPRELIEKLNSLQVPIKTVFLEWGLSSKLVPLATYP